MWILYVIFGIVVFFADQWTKHIALENLAVMDTVSGIPFWNGKTIEGIPHIFEYVYDSNTAGAMGITFPWARLILIIATFVLLAFLIVFMLKQPRKTHLMWISSVLLIAGGFGNLVDRIFRGYVPDFIRFVHHKYFPYIFNVADIAVCVGAVLLAVYILYTGESASKKRSGEDGGNL